MMERLSFRAVLDLVQDFLFPPKCVACGDWETADRGWDLCTDCLRGVEKIGAPSCAVCSAPLPKAGSSCRDCLARGVDPIRVVAGYRFEGPVREWVHRAKFEDHSELGDKMGRLMLEPAEKAGILGGRIIVPIPPHAASLVSRGYGLTDIAARSLAKAAGGKPVADLLAKTRACRAQSELPADRRPENVKGSFGLRRPERYSGAKVLLVDDVATTCATLDEAARTLLEGGISEVAAVVLARATY